MLWSSQRLRGMIARALIYPSISMGDDAVEGRIRAEQINSIRRYLSSMVLANISNASVLIVALWASPQHQLAITWASTTFVFSLYYGLRHRLSTKAKPLHVSRRAITRVARNALLLGSLWAMLPLLFFANASPGGQVVIACLCAGMLGGGAFVLASVPAATIGFTAPIVVASAIAIGHSGDAAYLLVAVLMITYTAILWRGVCVHASQIANRIAEQVQVESKVRRDELTSLPNRLAFFEALESAFARFARLHERFAVLYLDLNDFKAVNDRWGHATGDKLLVQVGQRLKTCVREIDLIARLSGDEFAVIVADATDAGAGTIVANRIVGSFDTPVVIDGIELFTGVCVGIALAPVDGASPELLLKSADDALYDAKHKSGGLVQLSDFGSRDAASRRRNLERDLRYAFDRGEFFLVFQPIFALDNNHITGCEALLRWRHPTLGVRLPAEFIAIMEENGLINEIGPWVVVEACKAAAAWPKHIRVAVNVSAIQLRHTQYLVFRFKCADGINSAPRAPRN